MTCKDCIHYDVCAINGIDVENTTFKKELCCGEFKDKSRIIELPCNVGDMVYVLEYEDDCAVDYSGYIFIMANNDFAFLSPIINGGGIIVPLNELYITKEEAEAKLKELNDYEMSI